MAENQNIEYKESWRDEYLKWICGFANAKGGKMYIGIDDKQNVVGVEKSHKLMEDLPNKIISTLGIVCDVNLLAQDGKEYIEIVVEPSNMPIAYNGAHYQRSGATNQQLRGGALQQFLMKKMGVTWDNAVIGDPTIDEIDRNAIDYFLRHAVSAKRLPEASLGDSTKAVLENLDLISNGGYVKNAGILLFGKRPEKYIPSVEFKIGRFGADESDLWFQDSVTGNILQMTDRVIELLRGKYLISPIHYEGLQRVEPLEIPEDALREAIFNSIVHKDYTGVAIQLKVYTDHLELWNEGRLPEDFTMEKLLGKHRSRPRNRKIARAFYLAGFIEAWGRGISKIVKGMTEAGLKEPTFEEDSGGLAVTIYRKNIGEMFNIANNNNTDTTLKEREQQVLELISANTAITIKEISEILGVSTKTIKRDIIRIREHIYIEWIRTSIGGTGHWVVKTK